MIQQQVPLAPTSTKPACWGKHFDETDRVCRGCGFQSTCREEIIKNNVVNQQPQPFLPQRTMPAQPQFAQAAAPHQPFLAPPPPPPPPQYRAAPLPIIQQYQGQPVFPPPIQYGYGWVNDPLYYSAHAAPPPMRPQFEGESFFERLAKNTGLALLESFFMSLFLATRQMVWPPAREFRNGSK